MGKSYKFGILYSFKVEFHYAGWVFVFSAPKASDTGDLLLTPLPCPSVWTAALHVLLTVGPAVRQNHQELSPKIILTKLQQTSRKLVVGLSDQGVRLGT